MLTRRKSLQIASGALAMPFVSRASWAQTYPSRSVRLIEPFGAGGVGDIVARIVGQWLQERLGQPVIIENRSGANGNIATEVALKSPADGYTLLLIGAFNTINASLYSKLNFDIVRDVAPVASISRFPFVMLVHPSVPTKTVPEFITFAKANPGVLNMASPGTGSGIHVCRELFKIAAGVDMLHVPFRGPQAITAMIAGQTQVYFGVVQSVIEHIKAGRLRALAVSATTRWPELPDVPTIADTLPGFEASGWFGIGAPKGTPVEIIRRLNAEINLGLIDARIKKALEVGSIVFASSPAEFGKHIADETEKWAKVIKAANIKPE